MRAAATARLPEIAPGGGVQIAPGLVRQRLLQPDKHSDAQRPGINLSQGQSSSGAPRSGAGGNLTALLSDGTALRWQENDHLLRRSFSHKYFSWECRRSCLCTNAY